MSCPRMASILEAFVGSCRGEAACYNCKEDELLTSALVERLERANLSVGKDRGEVKVSAPSSAGPAGNFRSLQVPPEFDGAQRKVLEAASGVLSPTSARDRDDQQRCLQACVRAFTRALLAGVNVCVLLDDNRTRLAEARLDSDITHLVLHVPHAQHPVALKYIKGICCPTATWPTVTYGEESSLQCRATLTMRGGQYLTFVFDTARVREYFEMCLKVLIIAKGEWTNPEDSGEEISPTPTGMEKDAKVEISSC
ncbi:unnamed protein product [Effrenium voratum]|nr:unnamed protein product [Effrenium voratum]